MKNYSLKSIGNQNDFLTILSHETDGYTIKILRNINGKNVESTDFISNEVFESCIKTGYLTEISEQIAVSA